LKDDLYQLAARIVRQANTNRVPADEELRQFFKRNTGFARLNGAEITRIVFTFYRWSDFANPKDTLAAKIRFADKRAEDYLKNPSSFSLRALKHAVPDWLEREMDLPYDWLASLQFEPLLWIRARRGHAEEVKAALKIPDEAVGPWPETMVHTGGANLFRHPFFKEGRFEIQDVASQMVGHLCAPQSGETWWDACAGEGGKTLHLSDIMGNKGLIWASDRSKRRLAVLKKRAARAQAFNVRTREWDGQEHLPTKTQFDGVLVDAPCSGIGTWQRNPHARWTTKATDVRELADVQQRLLAHVARSVKRGGKLVYAVCTLSDRETTRVAEAFTDRFPEFEPIVLECPPGITRTDESPHLTLWPQETRGSGMFVAAWRRSDAAG
jgi:16S rRNA (cytosine967-C5)-methyltransferase